MEKKRRLQGNQLDLEPMESISMNVAGVIANLAVLKKEKIMSEQCIIPSGVKTHNHLFLVAKL